MMHGAPGLEEVKDIDQKRTDYVSKYILCTKSIVFCRRNWKKERDSDE